MKEQLQRFQNGLWGHMQLQTKQGKDITDWC